jgi:hypothetical protein
LKDLHLVDRWREALVKQLLTPAPDLMSVTWKKAALAQGQYRYVGVPDQRIERAIAEDLAFLAAHPIRHNKSEAIVHRQAMRRRIRDVAASRDLSDEEIKPALTLKHQEIARFSEQHGVKIEWLLEGKGRTGVNSLRWSAHRRPTASAQSRPRLARSWRSVSHEAAPTEEA